MEYWLRKFGESDGQEGFVLSTANNSLVTSIISLGTFIGALLGSPIGDTLGRKWGVIASCVVFAAGVILQTASATIPVFAVGRVFAGLGVGLTSCLVPMYQSECAPKWIRGALVACYQLAIGTGILIAAVVVWVTKGRLDPSCYQIPIAIQLVWAFILAFGLFFLPESPKYLILKNRELEARSSLGILLSLPPDSEQVSREYEEVQKALVIEQTVGIGSYTDCFNSGQGRNRLRTLTGIGIQALQQFTGINYISYYGTSFFKNTGLTNPFSITVILNVVGVFSTILGILAIDWTGRRPLLLLGAVVMSICQFLVAILGVALLTSNTAGQHALIAIVCIYVAAFASTWGPAVWVVSSGIYPLAIRAKAMSLSTATNWALNFAIGYATPYLVDIAPGKAGLKANVFWIWGSCCVLCFGFTFFLVPETKGLSLEQVNDLYHNSSILRSNQYRRQLLVAENTDILDTVWTEPDDNRC
ncbi:hypothetical protein CROQUDRAFT_70637 [Cronartium quercuum f. sp. fusiforme G11]|uniref:Major facilitator superfamily (MFS) profile domain-containing protein n=1 Tax=Cronartium quercuum f. sp. fusiforme G11 TaxID=708437 RepID=A0A9P6NXW7_9BASI|nr:hypothetical protein CROQUDRAFT_70637 [Cronartium quercuum f. sp. fusiforme G11]